jgi:multicomponent Na+:H+ antiporter subunit D
MQTESMTPFLAMAVALVGGALIVATRRSPNLREGCSLVAAVLQFLLVVTMVSPVMDGEILHYTVLSFLPQVAIAFRVDALALLFAITASSGS